MRLCRPRQQSSCFRADKYCPLSRIEPWFLHRPTVYSIYLSTYCCLRNLSVTKNIASNGPMADPGGLAVLGESLWSLVCRDCGVRIPPWVWMSVSCEYCVTVRRQKNPTKKEIRHAMYVWRNTDVHSRNHWCSGKAISITYSECVSVTLGIQHVKRMRRIILSPVACPAVPHFLTLSQTVRCSGKIYWT